MAGLGLDDRPGGPSEAPAPVHYQISITGRQAGAFFLFSSPRSGSRSSSG